MKSLYICGPPIFFLFLCSAAANADIVTAGYDLQRTVSASQSFGNVPITGGFFDPNSDVFVGTIALQGVPVTFSLCGGLDIGSTDTVIERLRDAIVPNIGDVDVIPIGLIALSLESVNPITVAYNKGQNPELWNVRVTLSSIKPSLGSFTILHSTVDGGTFDCTLNVYETFTFERVIDGAQRSLLVSNNYSAKGARWSHDSAPLGCLACNGTNFFPGLGAGALMEWVVSVPDADHHLVPSCPTGTVAVESTTWGAVKARYR
jgi:hypothetical protein